MLQAARCLAFGRQDELARTAATQAYGLDSDAVYKAIEQDAELERVLH
jgi:hypothetical protein